MLNPILFYSTNFRAESLDFRHALLKGQAPDRGLYMPQEIPVISREELDTFSTQDYPRIAFEIIGRFLRQQIPDDDLLDLCQDAYDYDVPLEKVYDSKYIMRLDQGPTASFKDFAARMMGRLMQYYLNQEKRSLLILTATSGDTGSAIANAFYGLDNIKVVVLFPRKEVTARQRKQMTTLGKNVQILALDAKFDDCQSLVKQAFADPDLEYLHLSSANSINIGRLIPQIVYYFYAFARLRKGKANDGVIFSVPSGNFGDMMGGMLALKMGLPVIKYIIATNENDEFPVLVKTGVYKKIEPSRNCISSAMNVGHPSNLARLIALYGGIMDEKGNMMKQPDLELMRKDIYAVSIDDAGTRKTIHTAYQKHRLLLEPHGAVGWAGLQQFLQDNPQFDDPEQLYISLETAHPAKFPEQIREILNIDPKLPPSLEGIESKEETYSSIDNNYHDFKKYLITNY
ncbi:MAG: threonine synthase [Candidatus Cloacimonetes bacterium]|nr:threonine synthase [Candidatus Cloacimonadota bacterium]